MSDSDGTNGNVDRWSPSDGQFQDIQRKHKKWLESDGDRGERADLRDADLSEIKLRGVDLSGAYLRKVNLEGELPDIDLSDADLRGADLSDADFLDADLSDANLRGADLSGAEFWQADLSDANLRGADLSGAEFWEADLPEADLQGKDLSDTDFWKTDLREADFRKADLSGADLVDADLPEAKLRGADLSEANLSDADLSGAYLRGADLSGADLWNADLPEAKLQETKIYEARLKDADLRDTEGLQVQQIAQANTSNAILPDDIAKFDGLKTVEEASRGARKLFISLGLACAYSALAIWTVRSEDDGEEILTLTLPFIDVDIGLWDFHLVVPLLLAVGFGYLHLQLQRVWEEISRLPAIFPDGKAVDQKIHPWLITGFVRGHFPYLRENPIPLFRLQECVVILLAWGTVPATQIYFIGSFVTQFPEYTYHSGAGATLVVFTTIGAVISYQTAKAHLRGEYQGLFRPFGDEEDEAIRKQPNWYTVLLCIEWTLVCIEWTLAIFASWIGWTFVL